MGNREPVQMNEPENREDDRGQCEMELKRLTEYIWVMPYEEERDRPNLSYIRGDRWSLAVDAGHSEEHIREFYRELEEAGLDIPSGFMYRAATACLRYTRPDA